MNDGQAIAAFSALGNEIRFATWRLLLTQGSEGLPAGTVAERVGLSPSNMAFHLRIMAEAGLLQQRRTQRRNLIYYVVKPETVTALARYLAASAPGTDVLAVGLS
jgi:DNA-binding transcriptional ArsR family regulator